MTCLKDNFNIPYKAFPDGTEIREQNSVTFGTSRGCKVIKHEAKISIRYLVEYVDGSRRWTHEVVKRKPSNADILARVRRGRDEDDEDEDEDEDDEGDLP